MQKSPSFCHSYRTRNILTTFLQKSPSFGKSYITRNILTGFVQKSPIFVNPTVIEIFNPVRRLRGPTWLRNDVWFFFIFYFLTEFHCPTLLCWLSMHWYFVETQIWNLPLSKQNRFWKNRQNHCLQSTQMLSEDKVYCKRGQKSILRRRRTASHKFKKILYLWLFWSIWRFWIQCFYWKDRNN